MEKRMALTDNEVKHARERLDAIFPKPFSHLMFQLQHYAQTMQRFDVTFYDREPRLDVTLGKNFARALIAAIYAKNATQIALLLENVAFDTGGRINSRTSGR